MVLFVKHTGCSVRLAVSISSLLELEEFLARSRVRELCSDSSHTHSLFESACSFEQIDAEDIVTDIGVFYVIEEAILSSGYQHPRCSYMIFY